jgi:GH35 family endo-1,4-beta-xylanase
MSDRKKVLELFEEQKELLDKRINEGIEKYRKGDAAITVTDENGLPIPNAKISVTQKKHEFKFGANIFMLDELETKEKNELYKRRFAQLFNMATLPFYWNDLEPEKGKPRYSKDSPKIYRRPAIDLCIEYCEENGIEPREHALAYEHFFPAWLKDASVEEVKAELERRYKEIAERYKDKIRTIEVTNEMGWTNGVTKFYEEPDFIEWCFNTAEKYFPDNQLVINEYTNLPWMENCRTIDKYYAYIEANILRGVKIDAIGMQYHLFNKREVEYESTRTTLNPESLYKHMDLYARFNRPLQITEVTIPAYSWESEDEEIQADMIEKLYSIWFSHKNVEQIIYWNLVDGYAAFAPQGDMTAGENYYHGGLLRFDLSPKPAFLRLNELIHKRWHTKENLVTDNNGACAFRGFFGMYELEISANGKTVKKIIDVSSSSDNLITVTL